jgi:uncharacterized protein (DUF736 family)
MAYDDTNKGVLFKNNSKEKDSHPDYTGKINIDGTEKRLAAWVREGKNGTKFLSIAVSEPREQQEEDNGL